MSSLQISADELFGIYCSDDEYPAEIQEVLTEIALKVRKLSIAYTCTSGEL